MKVLQKALLVFILLLFIISIFANAALATGNSISLTSKWTANNGTSLTRNSGEGAELFVSVTSTDNFKLWIDVLNGPNHIKSVISNMHVPANVYSPYFQKFTINTSDLGGFSDIDYTVRVHVMNTNSGQSKYAFLTLTIKKKYFLQPWNPPVPLGNQPPVMNVVNDKEVNEGGGPELKFNVVATDPDNGDYITDYEAKMCTFTLPVWTSNGIKSICMGSSPLPSGANFVHKTFWGVKYGQLTWTPDYDYVQHPSLKKTVRLKFRAYDGEDWSNWEYVNVKVKDVNNIPLFTSVGDQTINEGETLTLDLIGTDLDNDNLSYVGDNLPAEATLEKVSKYNGLFEWTPDHNAAANSPYEMRIWVKDQYNGKTFEDIKIYVNDVNRAPIAENDTDNTQEEAAVMVPVLANDSDPDGDTISIVSVTTPEHGQAVINGNMIDYTPEENFVGTDSFRYTISDGPYEDSATVTITVNPVNDAPVADDIQVATDEDTPVTLIMSCTDADIEELTYHASQPENGGVSVTGNQATYTPGENYNDNDSFTYYCTDASGTNSNEATAYITVNPINDDPVAVDDSADTEEDQFVEIFVLNNDYDVDGDVITMLLGLF